ALTQRSLTMRFLSCGLLMGLGSALVAFPDPPKPAAKPKNKVVIKVLGPQDKGFELWESEIALVLHINGSFRDIDFHGVDDKHLPKMLGPSKKDPNSPCRVRIRVASREETTIGKLSSALDKIIAAAGPGREILIWIDL